MKSRACPKTLLSLRDNQALAKLRVVEQEQLLQAWDLLSSEQQIKLLEDVRGLDIPMFRTQQKLLSENSSNGVVKPQAFTSFERKHHHEHYLLGQKLIGDRRVGCLVVAGGQATRLGIEGPKGLVPVSCVRNKTLFQILAEKVAAASRAFGCPLPLAIMTSPLNHEATVKHFQEHHYFGLDPQQVSIFSQSLLPLLDEEGKLFLNAKGELALGPTGNGSALTQFFQQNLWDQWKQEGVDFLNFIQVDNPLANPFDAQLIGYHAHTGNDATVKCVEREDPDEAVGLLATVENRVHVLEYSEVSDADRYATADDGHLQYPCANISLFCFSMPFVSHAAQASKKMPWHLAAKACTRFPNVDSKKRKAWKFERFIFDALPLTSKVGALLYQRHGCFAPLKNQEGSDSRPTLKEALQRQDRVLFESFTGKKAPDVPFELGARFHFPIEEDRCHFGSLPLPKAGDYFE